MAVAIMRARVSSILRDCHSTNFPQNPLARFGEGKGGEKKAV